jgi:hypothetical protein
LPRQTGSATARKKKARQPDRGIDLFKVLGVGLPNNVKVVHRKKRKKNPAEPPLNYSEFRISPIFSAVPSSD